MIRMLTFWALPEWMSEAQFEEYFAGSHSVMARYMEGFRRYAVNRRLRRPPSALEGPLVAHHMSENWWDSVPEMERCFNSWGGLADFGDTVALHDADNVEMMFMRDEQISIPAYKGVDLGDARDGRVPSRTKVFGLFPPGSGDLFESWLENNRWDVAALHGLERLAVGREVKDICRLGWPVRRVVFPQRPAPYSRSLEMWFADSRAVESAFESAEGLAVLASLSDAGLAPRWAVMNNQDVFFSYDL
jgi:hypothetical protein